MQLIAWQHATTMSVSEIQFSLIGPAPMKERCAKNYIPLMHNS
jgi:hypothetical protein